MDILDWPQDLAHVLARLAPGKHVEMIVTPMDRGPPKRRPASSSGRKVYEGIVEVTAAQHRQIEAMFSDAATAYRARHPSTDRDEVLVLAMATAQTITVGRGATMAIRLFVVGDHHGNASGSALRNR